MTDPDAPTSPGASDKSPGVAQAGVAPAGGAQAGSGLKVLAGIKNLLRRLRRPRKNEQLLEDLEGLIEEREQEAEAAGAEGGEAIDAHERRLLANLFRLRDITAEEVMVPRPDIVAVDVDIGLPDLIRLLRDKPRSRIPVFKGSLDEAVGFIHIKDVVAAMADGGGESGLRLKTILREALFVAPSIRILDLLNEMRHSRTHIALVVDEYGGIDGLVTIEDIVECIVGEIEDEHDTVQVTRIVTEPDGALLIDGRAEITEIENRLGNLLSDEERDEIDTVGGLVIALAGRVPQRGEVFVHPKGLEIKVIEADPRRVRRVRLRPLPAVTAAATEKSAAPS